jgi:DNA-binding response OmpR family regulator
MDYDPDTLRLVDIKLRRAGFEVLTALTCERGLMAALTYHPDVLLAEVMMPDGDGRSIVAEAKRRLGARAPIAILMSQNGQEADIVAGIACGADDYIVKPFSPRELLVRITVALVRAGRQAGSTVTDEVPDGLAR